MTHYVGVAGVGKDAAQLPADDPRAGVFGYGRQTRQQDLVRGGAHTIAVLGVQDQCGPWAQGGPATVRPLTQEPYCNGPDGFGSGQADGMVAGFADGSVRFLSKNIDPRVMEQLATVRGGDQVDMALIEPKPPEAVIKPPVVPPKPPRRRRFAAAAGRSEAARRAWIPSCRRSSACRSQDSRCRRCRWPTRCNSSRR